MVAVCTPPIFIEWSEGLDAAWKQILRDFLKLVTPAGKKLGRLARDVMGRAVWFWHRTGVYYESSPALAAKLDASDSATREALHRCVQAGMLDYDRRYGRKDDGRVVQTSNTYRPGPRLLALAEKCAAERAAEPPRKLPADKSENVDALVDSRYTQQNSVAGGIDRSGAVNEREYEAPSKGSFSCLAAIEDTPESTNNTLLAWCDGQGQAQDEAKLVERAADRQDIALDHYRPECA